MQELLSDTTYYAFRSPGLAKAAKIYAVKLTLLTTFCQKFVSMPIVMAEVPTLKSDNSVTSLCEKCILGKLSPIQTGLIRPIAMIHLQITLYFFRCVDLVIALTCVSMFWESPDADIVTACYATPWDTRLALSYIS